MTNFPELKFFSEALELEGVPQGIVRINHPDYSPKFIYAGNCVVRGELKKFYLSMGKGAYPVHLKVAYTQEPYEKCPRGCDPNLLDQTLVFGQCEICNDGGILYVGPHGTIKTYIRKKTNKIRKLKKFGKFLERK